ncbi:MAG: hypothetical protein A3A97_01180 [Candidatus Terrybacteria bacterium RIFCSPLOWO2_01_FULL_40_23]|uniref:Uncharacterized protein n=1 Tax=Candidatus Terrybacteria bacterium RIFCSPLOWO2_01_FULL_40_23 TaxID=1802366 RepID=A0A1G2PWM9_9BACT|nr:MAG: hypothetical protein A3A97_01180 [Candidatus Terrybacteria bacterium RIFCSPLOWO2_01_FULL_40_23]
MENPIPADESIKNLIPEAKPKKTRRPLGMTVFIYFLRIIFIIMVIFGILFLILWSIVMGAVEGLQNIG